MRGFSLYHWSEKAVVGQRSLEQCSVLIPMPLMLVYAACALEEQEKTLLQMASAVR